MNLLILSRNFELYSTRRLVEEARDHGHSVSLWDPGHDLRSQKSLNFDAAIPRLGSYQFHSALEQVKFLEQSQVPCFNSSTAYSLARNKWTLFQKLTAHNLPSPRSFILDTNGTNLGLGFPLVAKQLESSQGEGVYLIKNPSQLNDIRERLAPQPLLIQEWIQESNGEDFRAFVVGNKVVAAMKRTAAIGDFRSNLHCGGQALSCELTTEEQDLAIDISKILGLSYAGIDFLRSNRGSLILEANPCPGLEGIEKCTKINIAAQMIKFLGGAHG